MSAAPVPDPDTQSRSTAGRAERFIWAGLALVLLASLVFGVGYLIRNSRPPGEAANRIPVLGVVPNFSLTERAERLVTRSDLAGRVWVADFIFTRCGSLCPLLTSRMARLQAALGAAADDVRLVSFSVDPAYDTPEVLRRYAERFRAHPTNWLFLTGERDALYGLIGSGFHLAVQERPAEVPEGEADLITHSDRFVLVDGRFRIRGYYPATEEDGFSELLRDLNALRSAP